MGAGALAMGMGLAGALLPHFIASGRFHEQLPARPTGPVVSLDGRQGRLKVDL